jgi:hypothetical protein
VSSGAKVIGRPDAGGLCALRPHVEAR